MERNWINIIIKIIRTAMNKGLHIRGYKSEIFNGRFYDFNIYGEERIILTKTRNDETWSGNICRNELDISKEYIWKIKILNSKEYKIKIGIIVNDFDSNRPTLSDIGWYYDLSDNTLYHVDKKKKKKKKKK